MPNHDLLDVLLPSLLPNSRHTPVGWKQVLVKCLEKARVELVERGTRAKLPPATLNAIVAGFDAVRREVLGKVPPLQVAYSDTVLSLSPAACCAGSTLMIHCASGTSTSDPVLMPVSLPGRWRPFPASSLQVSGGEVVFALGVPESARRGAVGLLKQDVQDQWIAYVNWVNKILSGYWREYSPTLGQFGPWLKYSMLEALCRGTMTAPIDHPSETGRNLFGGTKPEIESFQVDGSSEVVIQPGQTVRLTWQVWNATTISIDRSAGRPVVLHESAVVAGEWTYTPVASDGIDQCLRLTATNACGAAVGDVTVHLRVPSQVTVVGVEAVQSIQEYSFDDPARCHLIPLLKRKRTMVRVYLDSGVPPEFNHGKLHDVSGALTISGRRITALPPNAVTHATVTRDPRSSRRTLAESVNFIIEPIWLESDRLTASIEIYSLDPHAMWSPVTASLDLPLHPPTKFNLRVIEVVDKFGRQPSGDEVQASLAKLAAILPVDGIDGLHVRSTHVLETDLDFNEPSSWLKKGDPFHTDLFDLMEGAAEDIGDDNAIYCGIVAEAACDQAKGRGWPGGLDWIGGSSERIAYWRASLPGNPGYFAHIEAHEFGHACNLNENDNARSGMGVDLSQANLPRLVVDADQMMDSSSEKRWVSAAEYLWMYYRNFWKVIEELLEKHLGGSISVFSV